MVFVCPDTVFNALFNMVFVCPDTVFNALLNTISADRPDAVFERVI